MQHKYGMYTFDKWLDLQESHKWRKSARPQPIVVPPQQAVAPTPAPSVPVAQNNKGKVGWITKLSRLAIKCAKRGLNHAAAFITQHKDSISGVLFALSGSAAFFNHYAASGFSIAGGFLPILVEILKDLEPYFQEDKDYSDIRDTLKKVQTT